MNDYTEDDLDYISPPKEQKFYGSVIKGKKPAKNSKAWAIGREWNGFYVRRVVWGRKLARAEKRPGEAIRSAVICVAEKNSR